MQTPPTPQPVWQEFEDQSSGTKYYHNTVTKETTWQRPLSFPFACLPGAAVPTEQAPQATRWEPVPDTDWQIVHTDTQEQYYHNTKTGTTTWDAPIEITAYLQSQPDPSPSSPPPDAPLSEPQQEQEQNEEPQEHALTEEEILLQQQQMMFYPVELVEGDEEYEEDDESDHDIEEEEEPLPPTQQQTNEDTTITGKRARDDDPVSPPTDAKRPKPDSPEPEPEESSASITAFEDLLREHKVNQFSFWDMIESKISSDPRFLAIPESKERKRIFESYSQDKAKQQQQSKQQAHALFQALLQRAVEEDITRFSHFLDRFADSPGLKSLPKSEQKKLFKQHMSTHKAAQQSRSKDARDEFFQLLRTCSSIHADSRWSSRLKEKLRDDPRYDLLSSREREDAFYEYTDRLYREKKALERHHRAGDKSRLHREHVHTRREFQANEAEDQLRVLYTEFITKPCSWEEAQGRLLGKSRFENRLLSASRKRELFEKHLESLQQSQAATFYEMLKSTLPPIVLGSIYETCQMRLQNDPRYETLSSDEERKATFERYQNDLLRDAEKGFRALLRNMTTEITLSKSGPQFERALEIIKKDPRWRALDLRSDRRDALLEEYKASS